MLRPRAVAAALTLLTVLTACGDANKGDQGVADFRSWFADNPAEGVEIERAWGENLLPYAGKAHVTIAVSEPGGVEAAVEHVCGFRPGVETYFSVLSARVTVPFDCADGVHPAAELLSGLPGMVSAEVSSPEHGGDTVLVTFSDRATLVAGHRELSGLPGTDSIILDVVDELVVVEESGTTPETRSGFADVVASLDASRGHRVTRASARAGYQTGADEISLSVTGQEHVRPVRRRARLLVPGAEVSVDVDR